ncbi:hypothetical protein H0E87_015314 [Populus deltoides]|uniref:Uncharacterized protein n=1 Tax=Populus deltoides TaxID=3696 RepID=A0A8T2Y4M4_POPDE|nr:hypothetical protein H0E87_015314 [Populus deltoides]
MGLSSFPGAAGVLPELLMNTILLVALLKNTVRSVLQVMAGANWTPPDYEEEPDGHPQENARERRMSITQFKSLQQNDGTCYRVSTAMECCVCLCGFQAEEEIHKFSYVSVRISEEYCVITLSKIRQGLLMILLYAQR